MSCTPPGRSSSADAHIADLLAVYRLLGSALGRLDSARASSRPASLDRYIGLVRALAADLEMAARGDLSYARALQRLREEARRAGYEDWLAHAVADFDTRDRRGHTDAAPRGDAEESARALLHHALYVALLDLRVAAQQRGDHGAFVVADVFHTIPLRLPDGLDGRASAAAILGDVERRARYRGWDRGLEEARADARGIGAR